MQQIGVNANTNDHTSCEVVGPQNVDYLNCTKIVLFSFKNKKRMPVNAMSLRPNDVTFAYQNKIKVCCVFFS